jgi:hypothetical protein
LAQPLQMDTASSRQQLSLQHLTSYWQHTLVPSKHETAEEARGKVETRPPSTQDVNITMITGFILYVIVWCRVVRRFIDSSVKGSRGFGLLDVAAAVAC